MRVEVNEQMSEGGRKHASSQGNMAKDQGQAWEAESRIVELETAGMGLGVGAEGI